jgi:hypothetical protein
LTGQFGVAAIMRHNSESDIAPFARSYTEKVPKNVFTRQQKDWQCAAARCLATIRSRLLPEMLRAVLHKKVAKSAVAELLAAIDIPSIRDDHLGERRDP